MHNKGQIFSIDLLFGVILLLFGIGILIGAAEINNYNQKQQMNHEELVQKAILGAEIITNAKEWDCNFDGTHAAYSLNKNTFAIDAGNTIEQIKEKANLRDYNLRIMINQNIIYDEIVNYKDAIVFDLNIVTCTNNTTDFEMLRNCMNSKTACFDGNINKEIFSLMVAK